MAELQKDRIGGDGPARRRPGDQQRIRHIAVGYTNRATLDDFIDGTTGDVVIHGPVHTGDRVRTVETMGGAVTEGTPCLIVPLIRERIDEIRREISDVLTRFETGATPEVTPPSRAAEQPSQRARPRTIEETGGTARGTSSGAVREGSLGERRP